MGNKQKRWNISLEKGTEIAHSALITILNEKKNKKMPLNELIHEMNEKTKHYKIHIDKKYNLMSKFLKTNYNGIIPFLDTYTIYGISTKSKIISVQLLETELKDCDIKSPLKRITNEKDWVFI